MTLISTSAGNGGAGDTPTAEFGVAGTDLGFFFEGGKKASGQAAWVGAVFGDTFSEQQPGRGDWRSPVILRSSNRDVTTRGVVWDNSVGGRYARQAWPYNHIGEAGSVNGRYFDCFTVIPNDVLQLPDGNYLGCGFRVKRWGRGGNQEMCWTLSNAWFWSNEPHAETWQQCRHETNLGRLYEWENAGRDRFFQNATMVMMPGDPHVYVFGTPEGRQRGSESGIYLRRAHWKHLCNDESWEFWGWTGRRWEWGKHTTPTPILGPETPGGWIGEINAQVIHGMVVISYCDEKRGVMVRTAPRPDAVWSSPREVVTREQEPCMYAPSIHPWSRLDDALLHLSSWRQSDGVTTEYCTKQYRISITGESPRCKAVE